ncbi:MAG: hypothetical protein EOP10_15500 [Proteobacteria bacterium]|nr:MAG: hypothetical protein EOP10_15500 [Pseudomonadota bacterium]
MAKLSWNNLNRFQRNHVTRETKAFVEIENDDKLSERQKDVLFIDHYNTIIKQDYSSYNFPTSVPTAGSGLPKPTKVKAKAAPKPKKDTKAKTDKAPKGKTK